MGASDSWWKDVFVPVIGLVGALVPLIVGFLYRRLEAKLKLHVDIQVQKARGEVERELKNHEVRLRVAAEFRLKMLERMLADAADFRMKLGASIGAIYMLVHEVEPHGGGTERAMELFRNAQQAFAALSGAGPFMPTKLRSSAGEMANEFNHCLRDVVEWSNLPSHDERTPRCRDTVARMQAISAQSQKLFGDWQKESYDSFTQMLDRLGEPSKQENTALPSGPS